MERLSAWLARSAVILLWLSLTGAYYFEDGFDHHYTYSSQTELFGKKNITTVLKFSVKAVNTSANQERLHSLTVNSLVQFDGESFYQNNPLGWNLGTAFLFQTSLNGSLTLVHIHPDDHDELVVIKKAMTSLFHVTVRDEEKKTSTYKETDTDYLGELTHNYQIERNESGKTISRFHFSHERAQRTHKKVLHYWKDGTLHTGEAFDRIMLKKKSTKKRKDRLLPGEKPHNVTSSGDFPVISTTAITSIKLDLKRPIDVSEKGDLHVGLRKDSLQIVLKEIKHRLEDVSTNITRYLQCVHDHPGKGDANRTDCVHGLRKIMMSLHSEDYEEFAQTVLKKECGNITDRCSVERLVFIDIISRIADDVSQKLIVDHVLHREDPDEEEIRHVFIHCVGIERPIMHVVEAVENYCFGRNGTHHGSINVTATQRRACLAVGSLARNLHLNVNTTQAEKLVDKLHSWIDIHEKHPKYRTKRSLHFEKDHHYLNSKMTLIHSLGNAGHPKSLDRLITLTSPLQGHHDWRRAAVGALRHYTCDKSASALLTSALKDKKESVRHTAKHHYLRHPKGGDFSREQQNIILGHDYSWPTVARVRRSVLDAVLLQFQIGLPTEDWKKEIGTKDIGASFGVYFENRLSCLFRPLSGFVDLTIHDKMFAEVHIELIDFQEYILLIEVCYKGRLEYNVNKFKDFTVGLAENVVGAFDDMAQQIMKPLTDAANKMSSEFLESDGKTSKSHFEPLAKAVKNIPMKTGSALSATVELTKLIGKYKNLPWVTTLQQVADQAQSLMEGVNAEALNFYKKVSEAAVVGLPFAEKESIDAINIATKLMDKISKFPKQAFSNLEKSRLRFQVAMNRIFSSNSIINEVTSLLKAQSPSWLSMGKDISNAVSSLGTVFGSALKRRKRKRRSPSVFDQANDVFDKMGESSSDILGKVEAQVDKVIQRLEEVRDKAPRELQSGLDKQQSGTDILQNNFKIFQETIEKIKSTIQTLFGAKFHPKFPGQKRAPDSTCGQGRYPAGTVDKYGTNGIDLVLEEGWKVIAPVAGIVSKTGDNEVTIKPSDADFEQYEIIIANIRPSVSSEEKHYSQGSLIGRSAGKNGCEWSHIHLAVKKKTENGDRSMCFFLDPSPFVNTLKMLPVWQQECKDFTFKHIGQVIDFKNLGESLKKMVVELKRKAIDWVKGLANNVLDKLIPPDSKFASIKDFIGGIMGQIGNVSDVTGLFNDTGVQMKTFFSGVNLKKMDFGSLTGVLQSNSILQGALPKLTNLLGTATSRLKNPPLDLKSDSLGGLMKHFRKFGFSPGRFDLDFLQGKLGLKLGLSTSIFKVCPHFKRGLPSGTDKMCSADKDCHGFTCRLNIKLGFVNDGLLLKVRVHPKQAEVDVSLNGEHHPTPEGDALKMTGVKLGRVTLSLRSSARWTGDVVTLSLSVKPCYPSNCLPDVKFLQNLTFQRGHERYGRDIVDLIPDLESMDLGGILDQLANLNIPGDEFVGQLNDMMDGIRNKLSQSAEERIDSFTEELDAQDEYEDKQDFPNGNALNIPFFPPMRFPFPAGPVIVVISFDAGAELGVDISADVQSVKSTVTTKVAPFIAGKVEASMSISIVVASAGISLTGWLMKTVYPIILEMHYSKLPAKETMKLLVELTPLKLRLKLWVKLLSFIKWDFVIWEWTSPTLTGTILERTRYHTDNRGPRFPNCDSRKRSVSGSCSVRQLTGRHPSDTAFILEVEGEDDSSPLELRYSIGTSRGGRDVRSQVEMRGSSLTVPTTSLPNGAPLYFSVSATNTQNQTSIAFCMLQTFDNTSPNGSVNAKYQFTSHRSTIEANIVVTDDSQLLSEHLVALGYSPGEYGKEVRGWKTLHLEKGRDAYNTFISYENIKVEHGAQYFVNAKITNTLGYVSYLPSTGTLADFTPPEPGPVGDVLSDVLVADGCQAAVTQRCIDGNGELNHRLITDGPEGRTVFNGHRSRHDSEATIANSFISGNCDGFHDDESGIWGYTWAAATTVCGSDIVRFKDPHANHPDELTYFGMEEGLHLPDGPYYITFQAINNVVHGGALVTTVCHSKPYIVDTTPPHMHQVGDLLFDEDFDILGVYFNVSDDSSGVERVDFGLGRTKYDVFVRSYSRHPFMTREDPYFVVEDLGLQPGVRAWVRVRAMDKVELFKSGHGEVPILIDLTPPVAGQVLDGDRLLQDIDYQHDTTRICAQWPKFYDPESGIDGYIWGVGTVQGYDDIVTFHNYSHRVKYGCNDTMLQHNTTYYSTIIAVNGALNQKEVKIISNGVLVDITPPLPGYVQDGPSLLSDVDFSSKKATVESCWANFTDPESHVPEYEVTVYVNDELKNIVKVGSDTNYTDHTFHMKHLDQVRVEVTATNGAELDTPAVSDGYLVDETPPLLLYISDSDHGRYQSNASYLSLKWQFYDEESGILEYRYSILETFGGHKHKIWPRDKNYEVIKSLNPEVELTPLALTNGAIYSVSVAAMNAALLTAQAESAGVMVDDTTPKLTKILIALPKEEEEVDEDNNVVHIEGEPLHVSWTARDPESGIAHSLLCVVEDPQNCQDDDFVYVGFDLVATLSSSKLYAVPGSVYFVVVRVVNGAGLVAEDKSKPILVKPGNSAGTIYDGRNRGVDADYEQDLSSIAMSFIGFTSESCGITGYDWGVGTEPYATDIMRYTNYGLTMLDEHSGFAETSNTNFENTKYFVTVRAITGEKCQEPYIVSSSDGIIVDRTSPVITLYYQDENMHTKAVYQSETGILPISWNIHDSYEISSVSWSLGQLPYPENTHSNDIPNRKIAPGEVDLYANATYFITVTSTDSADNIVIAASPPITIDQSSIKIKNFSCTKYISMSKSSISCSWDRFEENESRIKYLEIGVFTQLSSKPSASASLTVWDHMWSVDVRDIIDSDTNMSPLYMVVSLENAAGVKSEDIGTVTVDHTGPDGGSAWVITSASLPGEEEEVQLCQIQTSYISVFIQEYWDGDSGIERYEIGLGTQSGLSDLVQFRPLEVTNGTSTVSNLQLIERSLVYVNIRVFNKAGLFTVVDAGSVAVSPEPYLTVLDGPGAVDIDSQHHLSVIQGSWILSDPCPIISAEWAVEDVTGSMVKDFEHTPGNGQQFYNDELTLQNMKTYIVSVKVVDALNRTIMGRSDGVIVHIQPPEPGIVRDGLGKDLNYQYPTDYLAANWDPFGDPGSAEDWQQIEHYEVAIGEDTQREESCSNIHFFENVGLNTSHEFHQLNLTAKSQWYFISVRAYSIAGSFEESNSNGIRVGYGNEIEAGAVLIDAFQSSTSQIAFRWTKFVSDFEIREYSVAVHDNISEVVRGSNVCRDVDFHPLVPFRSTGLATMAVIDNLHLNHSQIYYVIVKAEDEAGICLMVASDAVTVDTTPPQAGDISIEGGRSGDTMYTWDSSSLHVHLSQFTDDESPVDRFTIQLLVDRECDARADHLHGLDTIQTLTVTVSETHIYDIRLDPDNVYYLNVSARNKAGLTSHTTSSAIVTDSAPPISGDLSFGTDWKQSVKYTSNLTELFGTLALQATPELKPCLSQEEIKFDMYNETIEVLRDPFSIEAVEISTSHVQLYGRLNPSLSQFHKGGIRTRLSNMIVGNYTFTLQLNADVNMTSSFGFIHGDVPRPEDIIEAMNRKFLDNCSRSDCHIEGRSEDGSWSIGVLYTIAMDTLEPVLAFWVRDNYSLKVHLFSMVFDPMVLNSYTFHFHNASTRSHNSWQVVLFVNGDLVGIFEGVDVSGQMSLFACVWNINDYIPEVVDPFDPYSRHIVLTSIKTPVETKTICNFRKIFRDANSGIKDIHIGISDSQNLTCNIAPYTRIMSLCVPCDSKCIINCTFGDSCDDTGTSDNFLLDFNISNLSLTPSSMPDIVNYTDIFISAYYFDVKVTDHAGHSIEVKSEGIIVDVSPPLVTDVRCYDPEYSLYESALYLGNDHTIAVSWDVSEDFSDVTYVFVAVGTICGGNDVIESIFQDQSKQLTLTFDNGTFAANETYYVSVNAHNSAGLQSTTCCNMTTDFRPPSLPSSEPEVLFTTSNIDTGMDVDFSHYSDRLGIQWTDPLNDVEYFVWHIKNEDTGSHLYPPIITGSNRSRMAEVIRSDILVANKTIRASASEFFNRNISDGMTSSDLTNAALCLEPGRCVLHTVSAVSRSHRQADYPTKRTCIKRMKDILLTKGDKWLLMFNGDEVTRVDDFHQTQALLQVSISGGAMTVGVLSKQDREQPYGAPAAQSHHPYIVDLDITRDRLSRYLRRRLIRFVGESFFLAPVTEVHLKEDAYLNMSTTELAVMEDNTEPALLFWDVVGDMWRHVFEVCEKNENRTTRYFKICSRVFSQEGGSRERRSANVQSTPRMLTGAVIKTRVNNTEPVIKTSTIECFEDQHMIHTITYRDYEDDILSFTLETGGKHGSSNITSTGQLFYEPNKDFYGQDSVNVKAEEVLPRGLDTQPFTVSKTIFINVVNVNDQPVSFFQYGQDTPTIASFVQPINRFFFEGNQTEHHIGLFWIADIDRDDNLELLEKHSCGFLFDFNLIESNVFEEDNKAYNNLSEHYSENTISHYMLNVTTKPEYHGNVNFSILAKDQSNIYSHPLTVEVFVLINPCQYGSCAPTTDNLPCNHPTRALSFDLYTCECEAGYEGEFCQQEINECFQATCSLLYDCEDKVAHYVCVLSVLKILTLLMCILAAFLLGLLVYYVKKRKMRRYPIQGRAEATSRDTGKYIMLSKLSNTSSGNKPEEASSLATREKDKGCYLSSGNKPEEVGILASREKDKGCDSSSGNEPEENREELNLSCACCEDKSKENNDELNSAGLN